MSDNTLTSSKELSRLIELSELDLDYTEENQSFNDLVKLAARVAGTEVSLLNLIDLFTQWTIAGHGLPVGQVPREESVCQYTILSPEQLEIKDLKQDERFKNNPFVRDYPALRFYFGVPLRTRNGYNIGALCVLDSVSRSLPPEKTEMLKIIANEIVNRLIAQQTVLTMHHELQEAREARKRVAHDIRSPLGGIIGLTQLISIKGDKNNLEDVLDIIHLIQKSSTSLLEMADEILSTEAKTLQAPSLTGEQEQNLAQFKDKLEKLYQPQALNKGIHFSVKINSVNSLASFPKSKLLQIAGNLISNAIKFTPPDGKVAVSLDLITEATQRTLHIQVSDSGIGLTEKQTADLLGRAGSSTTGTTGERGYGFGLPLVKHLIGSLHGTMHIKSAPDQGTTFTVVLPVV